MTVLFSIVMTLALLFGGAGATVYSAQNDLPGDALYGVKTFSEDIRMALTGSTTGKIDLNLDYADARIQEMADLYNQGQTVPEGVKDRLQSHIDAAITLTASLDDAKMVKSMVQIHVCLRDQVQSMGQMHSGTGTPPEDATLVQAREMLQQRLGTLEDGLENPMNFRLQFKQDGGDGQGNETTGNEDAQQGLNPSVTPSGDANSYGPGPAPEVTPGDSYGPGPQPEDPPGGAYGAGEPLETHEPNSSYGPGPQPTEAPGDSYGPGPEPSEMPGNSYGPGNTDK